MEESFTPRELALELGHTDGGKRIRSFLRSNVAGAHMKHQSWVLSNDAAEKVRAHFRSKTVRVRLLGDSVQVDTDSIGGAPTPSIQVEHHASRTSGRRRCQTDFGLLCAEYGLSLETDPLLPGLTNRGHLTSALRDQRTLKVLKQIFDALGGDERELGLVPQRLLESDFLHRASHTLIEVDEVQHFTTHRRTAIELYPSDIELGFDRDEYLYLIEMHHAKADRAFAHKSARAFGNRGRPRQRAYLDAVRDLILPTMGFAPVIRVAAPEGVGELAFSRFSSSGQLEGLI